MFRKATTICILSIVLVGVAIACAEFEKINALVTLQTNPSADPRGAWNDIGQGLAQQFPELQAQTGFVAVRYEYCAWGVCGSYGVTLEKLCDKTFQQTADEIGAAAAALLNPPTAGGGAGLPGGSTPLPGCFHETIQTCMDGPLGYSCRADTYMDCGFGV